MKSQVTIKSLVATSSLPKPESEMILAFLLNKSREFILININFKIPVKIEKKFKEITKKRTTGYPLEYLLKEAYFYGYQFIINKHALIPRPETELLIDLIIKEINNFNKNKKINFLDIGTGSGIIAISLAKEITKKNYKIYQKSSFYALDISSQALTIAEKNIKKHKLTKKIKLLKSDLLSNLPHNFWKQKKIILAANLPYLTKKQIRQEKNISWEPIIALDGGIKGVKLYKQLFSDILKQDFLDLSLYCEIDPNQAPLLKKIAKKQFNKLDTEIKIIKDLRKKNRFLIIKTRKRS